MKTIREQCERVYESPVISRMNYVRVIWPLSAEDVGFPEKYFFARQHSGSPCAVTAKGFGLVAGRAAAEGVSRLRAEQRRRVESLERVL